MVEKSDDYDLVDAVLVPPSEATLRAAALRGKRSSGFLRVPARDPGATGIAPPADKIEES